LTVGTIGNCGNSGCHSECASSASTCFDFLQSNSDIVGINGSGSVLSWFGGYMPVGGPGPGDPSAAPAIADFNAWVAAGSKND
jgi:hypothetical protein